jgi:hypothetical protein
MQKKKYHVYTLFTVEADDPEDAKLVVFSGIDPRGPLTEWKFANVHEVNE